MKNLWITLAAITIGIFLSLSTANCVVPPNTPGDTVCKAELTDADCARFQKIFDRKKVALRIIEGCAFATAANLKKKNYMVILKCVNTQHFITIVKLAVICNSRVTFLHIDFTNERQLPT